MNYDIIIVGGGEAGFFNAVNLAKKVPVLKIDILERGKEVLSKVKISGGGRCNVTHACFVPKDLTAYYPRGEKELLGPFHTFCSGDTIAWFEERGVALKIEEDGRMFPEANTSQAIIDCFLAEAKRWKVAVLTGVSVQGIFQMEQGWKLDTTKGNMLCDKLVMTTGSNPKIWEMLETLGHTIVPPVPSLFTFNIKDKRLKDLMGLSAPAEVTVKGTKLKESGPVLITHWGLSGPGILRLSAWGARALAEKNYQFVINVNWSLHFSYSEVVALLQEKKVTFAKKLVVKNSLFDLPNRLWERIVEASEIGVELRWAELTNKTLDVLAKQITAAEYQVNGKSTFKEEFVTAGGVALKEVNFKTMESKVLPEVYFAGEIVNIDAITGGFNFQNAWTSGFIVSEAIHQKLRG